MLDILNFSILYEISTEVETTAGLNSTVSYIPAVQCPDCWLRLDRMKQVYEKRRDGFNGSIEILSELQWGWVVRVSVHLGSWLRDPAARDRG